MSSALLYAIVIIHAKYRASYFAQYHVAQNMVSLLHLANLDQF